MLRAEVMKVFLCIRSPHPDWGLGSGGEKKKKCREADQEQDYQFSHRNLTLSQKQLTPSDTKES